MLSIYEELYLLALDEEKGNTLPFAKKTLAHGLAGGILAELALLGKVCSNEKHRLEITDAGLTSHEILDEAMKEIQTSEKPRKLAYWVSQLSARPKKLRERIGESLVKQNLLYQDDRRFFWRPPTPDDSQQFSLSKFEMKIPLRAAILSTEESDPRHLALLAVTSAAGLLSLIFTQDELPIAQHRTYERVIRAAMVNPAMQTVEDLGQEITASLEDDAD